MLKKRIGLICSVLLICVGIYFVGSNINKRLTPIRVGILHSLTGTMAASERPVVDAALLAIEEINAKGGLLGRQLEPILADGASDERVFAEQAEILIIEKHVDVIFGCWTSASRKSVRNVIEKHDNILFYPLQYEGIETSPNIIYTGALPNQQIFPALLWCMQHVGNRFFIVGSDYIYPRIAGIIIHMLLDSVGASIVGEHYMPLASVDVADVVEDINRSHPDVIINLINGETNVHFFKALRGAGITSDKIPTVSFSIGEPEIQQMGAALVAGDYASWSYMQTVQTDENHRFINAFKKRYGQDRTINDPMEAAYFSVYLWSQAVKLIGTTDPMKVIKRVQNQVRVVPEGIVSVDGYNHNTWKMCRLGQISATGQFDIVWSSEKSVYPVPYLYKSQDEWDNILRGLYVNWGNKWSK